MPEYLAPGVYIEEKSFRPKTIEGVSTSTTAFVGPTRKGPLSGLSEIVTSFAEYQRVYGGMADLLFNVNDGPITNYMAHAVRAFFENGGKRLYIARTFTPRIDTTDNTEISAIASAEIYSSGNNKAEILARAPGTGLNGVLRVYEKSTPASRVTLNVAPEGSLAKVTGTPSSAEIEGTTSPSAATEEVTLTIIVNINNEGNDYVSTRSLESADVITPQILEELFPGAPITFSTTEEGYLTIRTDAVGRNVQLHLSGNALPTLGLGTELTAIAYGSDGSLYYRKLDDAWNGEGGISDLNIDADNIFIVTFNAEAEDADRNTVFYEDLGFASTHPRAIHKVLAENQLSRTDALENPYYLRITNSVSEFELHHSLFPNGATNSFSLTGGHDGSEPESTFNGEGYVSYEQALRSLENIEDISIVAAPGSSALAPEKYQGTQQALIAHVERMKYRFAVLDTRPGQTPGEARQERSRIDSKYAALYYPWVVVPNPQAKPGNAQISPEVALPPSGFIAGIYARTDNDRGVWKAPANEVVRGALRFELELNQGQQEVLNPEGINCLRFFLGRGYRVWGARTASSDPEWKYVNVRRYFIFLERSIDRSTQWAVFEPNGQRLWANIRDTVEAFLYNQWRSGALLGGTPAEAYFVRCDRSTMTQNDLDNGRLVCEVGVAALKPAEFVIFRIGQKTADARS
jgi:phage tail sheath protein FI